ncbi:hypothetical protein BGZ65_009492, partial [Modicella reniformis]
MISIKTLIFAVVATLVLSQVDAAALPPAFEKRAPSETYNSCVTKCHSGALTTANLENHVQDL